MGPRRNASRWIAYSRSYWSRARGSRPCGARRVQPLRARAGRPPPTATTRRPARRRATATSAAAHRGRAVDPRRLDGRACRSTRRSSAWPRHRAAQGSWRVASDGGIFTSGDAHVLRLGRHRAAQPADRRHGRHAVPGTATGSSPATAASSASATRTSTARPAHRTSTSRSSAWRPRPPGTATGSSPATAASSASATRTSTAPPAPSTSTSRSSAARPRRRAAATGSSRATAASSRFGDARFHGSVGNAHLTQPIVGMAPASSGNGYLLLAAERPRLQLRHRDQLRIRARTRARVRRPSRSPPRRTRAATGSRSPTRRRTRSPRPRTARSARPATTTKLGAAAADLFDRMNDERARTRACAPLSWNPTLATYAAALEPDDGRARTCTTATSAQLLGPFDYVGENIAMGSARRAGRRAARRVDALAGAPRQHPLARLPGRRDRRVLRARRLDLGHHRVRPADQLGRRRRRTTAARRRTRSPGPTRDSLTC